MFEIRNNMSTMNFLKEGPIKQKKFVCSYKILIADDDEEVHAITKMILKGFEFENCHLEFLHAYSGKEAMELLSENPDIAVLFLDVVMEEVHSGLKVIDYLRKTLKNHFTRIILRTGQPGEAPEEEIIREYDINDYRLKTEMTVKRMFTTLYSAIRNYRDLMEIERNRKGLEKIVKASSELFEENSLDDFLKCMLSNLSSFQLTLIGVSKPLEEALHESDGLVAVTQQGEQIVVAATGRFSQYVGASINRIEELDYIARAFKDGVKATQRITFVDMGFIVKYDSKNSLENYIYIEGPKEFFDFELINLFLTHYAVALDNFVLHSMVNTTQRELIITLAEVVESHFDDTAGHIRRISDMMYRFGEILHFSHSECELLKVASTMHDIGKIGIPDEVLKKPDKLSYDEFEIIKRHTAIGYKILSKSDLELLRIASEIALNHHERHDGSGYPTGKKGREIPLRARMMAIVDVYDAMSYKRVYKSASSQEEVLSYIENAKGTHFDPALVDLFIENLEYILHGKSCK